MKPKDLCCFDCGQQANTIFRSLPRSLLARLEREKTVHEYQRGQIIFYEGDQPFVLYCIYSGRVKLYKVGRKAEPYVIRLLGLGEIMGYRALLANEPYAATSEAVEPAIICTISKETLFDLLKKSPELTFSLLAKLIVELRTSEEQILSLVQESVRQRTARLLLSFLEGGGEKNKKETRIEVPLSRNEMAQMVGTTPETFSRTLHYFAKRGILRLTRSEILLTNLSALEILASAP